VTSEPRLTRVPLLATLGRWRMTAGGENLTTQHRTGRRRRGEQVAGRERSVLSGGVGGRASLSGEAKSG
jgi:hypothetical protein